MLVKRFAFIALLLSAVFPSLSFGRTGGINEGTGGGNGGPEISLPFGFPIKLHDEPSSGGGEDGGSDGKGTETSHIVYKFDLTDEIGPSSWRQTQAAFRQASALKADFVLIHMNTWGGAVDAADNIRQHILDYDRPVMVYIDRNAASAGALISLACDSIYMSKGASFGAATVVDQNGTPAPEKYQSYMRSILRSTAEATGRDPKIAEAMNDPRIYIAGVNDSGKVLTFTSSEALRNRFCNAEVGSIHDLMLHAGLSNYKLVEYKAGTIERIIDFLLNPIVSGVLILLIVGGIYFELQHPGVGLPLFVALGAAILYFAPLYLEGLARNWEILMFIAGVVLLVIEIYAIPGFGFVGIAGIVLMLTGLTLAMVDGLPSGGAIDTPNWNHLGKPLLITVSAMLIGSIGSFWLSDRLLGTTLFGKLALKDETKTSEGWISNDIVKQAQILSGKQGTAFTILRPSGKVEIDGELYDATAETGYIEQGDNIMVIDAGISQLVVRKVA